MAGDSAPVFDAVSGGAVLLPAHAQSDAVLPGKDRRAVSGGSDPLHAGRGLGAGGLPASSERGVPARAAGVFPAVPPDGDHGSAPDPGGVRGGVRDADLPRPDGQRPGRPAPPADLGGAVFRRGRPAPVFPGRPDGCGGLSGPPPDQVDHRQPGFREDLVLHRGTVHGFFDVEHGGGAQRPGYVLRRQALPSVPTAGDVRPGSAGVCVRAVLPGRPADAGAGPA